ncbi:DUF3011 domain-containing protein [Lysobacter soyae]|uniref:DUF3011 domain-containing protein n=1 Tax=Lysobacter soyae TaxID=2764185 RepID=UPI002105E9B3|nr:DUF3011 domain-containing protein [Lysobacter sp. CJ11]
MRIQNPVVVALGLCALASTAYAQQYGNYRGGYDRGGNGQVFECASVRNDYRECAVPGRGNAVIIRQISKNACVEGRTWGQRNGTVWVQKGCRAQFQARSGWGNGRGGRWDNNNGRYGNTSSFLCESIDGRQNYCGTNTRGEVRFRRQISKSACIEGRTWGIDRRGVWVAGGCRAEFEVRGY